MSSTKQRGSGWSINLVFSFYKIFGYKFIYYLMYPVTFFYFLFASNVKKSLKIYYKNLNIPFTNKLYYNHLRIFAICMVDRFISRVSPESYTFEYDNIDVPTQILDSGTILLYSHFGGWAASSNSSHVKNKVNIVMKEVMLASIKNIETSIESENNTKVIDLSEGTLSVSIQIANALLNNEIVAIMADRASNKESEVKVNFMNKEASFNRNPFQIAYKLDKPILVYFIILIGMQKYKVDYLKIDLDRTKKEEESVNIAIKKYTKKYEEIIKMYPNQWFNFYNFWEK